MIWRLQLHRCLNPIKTNWFRSSATTAAKAHKCSTMLWPGNARTVNLTTLDKPEAEPVATFLQSNWFEHWLLVCTCACVTRLVTKALYSLDHLAISGEVVVRVVLCYRAVAGGAPSCFIYLYFLSCISMYGFSLELRQDV